MNAAVDAGGKSAQSTSVESVGQALRRLRESQGKTVADVCARLKFSARQIDALENERWDDLPKGLPMRGLIRSYARMLGADADALLAALASQVGEANPSLESSVADVPAARVPIRQNAEGRVSLIWAFVMLAVFAVIVVYAFGQDWLPQKWLPDGWFADVAQ